MVRTHKDLDVWKKGIEFVTAVYQATDSFPNSEIYGLTSQIRRSAVSIPSNIAEGATRQGVAEFKQFLHVALASAAELETQLVIAGNLEYIQESLRNELLDELGTISHMIQGLIKSITRQIK